MVPYQVRQWVAYQMRGLATHLEDEKHKEYETKHEEKYQAMMAQVGGLIKDMQGKVEATQMYIEAAARHGAGLY